MQTLDRQSAEEKPNNKRPDNLRPIALQNTLSKLTAKILANRLNNIFHKTKALHPANEGFIKGGSTSNTIHTLLDIWEDAKQHNQACFNLQIDITGAYDNLPWYAIERAMKRLHLPMEFQEYCMKRMENCFIKFRTAYGYSEPLQIRRGVPQGDPLSCLLFVMCLDHLHSGMEANPTCKERTRNFIPYTFFPTSFAPLLLKIATLNAPPNNDSALALTLTLSLPHEEP